MEEYSRNGKDCLAVLKTKKLFFSLSFSVIFIQHFAPLSFDRVALNCEDGIEQGE